METINAIEVKGLWAAYEDRMIIEDMNLKIRCPLNMYISQVSYVISLVVR